MHCIVFGHHLSSVYQYTCLSCSLLPTLHCNTKSTLSKYRTLDYLTTTTTTNAHAMRNKDSQWLPIAYSHDSQTYSSSRITKSGCSKNVINLKKIKIKKVLWLQTCLGLNPDPALSSCLCIFR